MKQWLKQVFCLHRYTQAEKTAPNSTFKFRVCKKCGKSQAGGYASDGRFYWAKWDGQLKAKELQNDDIPWGEQPTEEPKALEPVELQGMNLELLAGLEPDQH